jgi:hypothetical protein
MEPPIQWVSESFSPWVEGQGREADHSHTTSEVIKKTWIHTSTFHTPLWRSS